jgi:hypothetical protein
MLGNCAIGRVIAIALASRAASDRKSENLPGCSEDFLRSEDFWAGYVGNMRSANQSFKNPIPRITGQTEILTKMKSSPVPYEMRCDRQNRNLQGFYAR